MLRWRELAKERELRMGWGIERAGRRSVLVGAAHFFPYHFRGALRRLLGAAGVVVFEGPLDEHAMRRVVDSGRGIGGRALLDALSAEDRRRILERLGTPAAPLDVPQLIKELVFGRPDEWLQEELKSLKPWMAFFGIWTRYRAQNGWTYTLDLDASRIAAELGKPVRHLETIEEQIAALDAIPLERIVRFLALEDWTEYCERYVERYLAGDLDGLFAAAQAFPSYCEPVLGRRDPRLVARMRDALEQGGAVVVVGVAHCPGVIAALREAGFAVEPLAG
jgi:hypothetical protein